MNQMIVVKNTLPAEIVAISPEIMAEALELVKKSGELTVSNAEEMTVANGVFKQIDQLVKKVSSGRLEITRPIDALKKSIIEAEETAVVPLKDAKKSLGEKIVTCQKELQRIADEAAAKAKAEAEEKARIERERLEKERQEQIKKQQEDYEAECKKKAAEAEMFGESEPVIPPPPPPPPVPVVPVVVEDLPSANIPKAAARTTERKRLVIVDPNVIPLEIGGVRLLVPDEKAITGLLKAGVAVPGCKLESYSTIGASGR